MISHSGKPTQEMFSGLDTEDTCGSFASGTADEIWCCIVIRLYPVVTAYGIVHCWYQGHWLKQMLGQKKFFFLFASHLSDWYNSNDISLLCLG